jgi:hypothetical protein
MNQQRIMRLKPKHRCGCLFPFRKTAVEMTVCGAVIPETLSRSQISTDHFTMQLPIFIRQKQAPLHINQILRKRRHQVMPAFPALCHYRLLNHQGKYIFWHFF